MNYRQSYWSQIANPWVSASVLVGGLVSAVLLYGLVQLSNGVSSNSSFASSDIANLTSQ